jgi:hypothetical protein
MKKKVFYTWFIRIFRFLTIEHRLTLRHQILEQLNLNKSAFGFIFEIFIQNMTLGIVYLGLKTF